MDAERPAAEREPDGVSRTQSPRLSESVSTPFSDTYSAMMVIAILINLAVIVVVTQTALADGLEMGLLGVAVLALVFGLLSLYEPNPGDLTMTDEEREARYGRHDETP